MIAESNEWKKNCARMRNDQKRFSFGISYRRREWLRFNPLCLIRFTCFKCESVCQNVNWIEMALQKNAHKQHIRYGCESLRQSKWYPFSVSDTIIDAASLKLYHVQNVFLSLRVTRWSTYWIGKHPSIHRVWECFCGFNLDCMKFDTNNNGLSNTCLLCNKLCSFVASLIPSMYIPLV